MVAHTLTELTELIPMQAIRPPCSQATSMRLLKFDRECSRDTADDIRTPYRVRSLHFYSTSKLFLQVHNGFFKHISNVQIRSKSFWGNMTQVGSSTVNYARDTAVEILASNLYVFP